MSAELRSAPARAIGIVGARLVATRAAARFLPSARSLLAAGALVASAIGLYAAARTSSVFAVRSIEVHAGSPRVAREVRSALRGLRGAPLLALGQEDVERLLATVPDVQRVAVDRAFPHTLVVTVRRERPVGVLRQGAHAWLVSARGRVLRPVVVGTALRLPRVWVGAEGTIRVGATVGSAERGEAVAALGAIAGTGFGPRVLTVRARDGELTFVLRSGSELRLGDRGDIRLKVAIARRILRLVGADGSAVSYLDVSVPERPVVAE
jgi:hypothetical protein